jgi:DNA-binding NtrC family response regulator
MRVLAVDDDPAALSLLTEVLAGRHDVTACSDGAAAVAALGTIHFDAVLTDLRMPPPDGFEILKLARGLDPPAAVIVLSGMDTARAAVDALRLGACDFLVKPSEPREIVRAVAGIETARITAATDADAPEGDDRDCGLAGSSAPIRLVRRLIPAMARSSEVVLILGETGTGKELLARALHHHGPRARGPFIAHNMAATPAELAESLFFGHVRGAFSGASADHLGLFEQAEGGTLFLDEMDSFPLGLQAKLLRVLESGRVQRVGAACDRAVDTRVIAASAFDLGELVARGTFRVDLYYRLRQLEVMLPPLRERATDVPALARRFLAEIATATGRTHALTPAALERLARYSWPGNVRELRNAVRAAAVIAGTDLIRPEHLPRALGMENPASRPLPGSLRNAEIEHIMKTLESVGGNQSQAARILGIDRGTLARRVAQYRRERGQG